MRPNSRFHAVLFALLISGVLPASLVFDAPVCRADGKLQPPRRYSGSLEERAQEALIVFKAGDEDGAAVEDLILKIRVEGAAERFAWIVPFPKPPKVKKANAKIFRELFDYVQARKRHRRSHFKTGATGAKEDKSAKRSGVKVWSREVVGSYDVAVVQETKAGALNRWLTENGYQTLDDAEDVLTFYREKEYVFACIKVDETQLHTSKSVDLHPLRFTFKTGGRDGIYFPMKLTGLQSAPFDVNLYVLYRYWLNDHLSKFGYEHRGFQLNYRDWDSPECEANAGKAYTAPESDPFLKHYSHRLRTVTKLLQGSYPGERFYLTNIQAFGLKPQNVRDWPDDLWLFPYYTNRARVPYDARPGGVASAAWPNQKVDADGNDPEIATPGWLNGFNSVVLLVGGIVIGLLLAVGFFWWRGMRAAQTSANPPAESP